MSLQYSVQMLGGFRVKQEDRIITHFRTRKTGELLAFLACHPGRSVAREQLVELFFSDLTPAAARNNLSQLLSSLRRQLDSPQSGSVSILNADRFSVGLDSSSVTTDVEIFEAHLQSAEKTTNDLAAIQALTEALESYGGPLLPDVYEDWAQVERARLAELYYQALRTLVRLIVRGGDLRRALGYAQQAVTADPLREEAHRDLMRLYLALGQPASALKQYRELERRLQEELDISPGGVTRQLLAEIKERSLIPARGEEGYEGESEPDADHVGTEAPDRKVAPQRESQSNAPHAGKGRTQPSKALNKFPFAPPSSGTVTFLVAEVIGPGEPKEGHTAFNPLQEDVQRRLRAELRRYGGGELRDARGVTVAVFSRASDAAQCAVSIQEVALSFSNGESAGHDLQSQVTVRIALDTREIRLKEGSDPVQITRLAIYLLQAGHGGQVLCSEATAVLLRRDLEESLSLSELGRYLLEPMRPAEGVFQVERIGVSQTFPPLLATNEERIHLPPVLTRFYGREEELEQLKALLEDPAVRLITLIGPGGVGKTRLAIEAAGRWGVAQNRAVWWVGLMHLTDAQQGPDALVSALGLKRSTEQTALDQGIEFLRRQPALLVLDNFEHLVDEGATMVGSLLERVPGLVVMVTSRNTLALTGEHLVTVGPLPIPEADARLKLDDTSDRLLKSTDETLPPKRSQMAQVMEVASVALFVDRARASRPDFQITERNYVTVAKLCRRLEGLPLAIELAAARSLTMSPRQMLEQLQHRLDFLVSRRRDIQERHRTLRATIEWSYRLLSPEHKRGFARLSVFRGGWDLEAAAAVCTMGDVGGQCAGSESSESPNRSDAELSSASIDAATEQMLDLITQLQEGSLITSVEGPMGMRYSMLESLRDFAAERLVESVEVETIHKRHYDYFMQLSDLAREGFAGPKVKYWLERLEQDRFNIDEALEWALSSDDAESAARLAGSIGYFWEAHGYLIEGRRWLKRALERCKTPDRIRAIALTWIGSIALKQGDDPVARQATEESLDIHRRLNSPLGVAGALGNLSILAANRGDLQAAREAQEERLKLYRELGYKMGVATALHYLGNVCEEQEDYNSAKSLWHESIQVSRECGSRLGAAYTLSNLGRVCVKLNDYERARAYLEESLALHQEFDSRLGVAHAVQNLGKLSYQLGDYAGAIEHYTRCLEIWREQGSHRGVVLLLEMFAEVGIASNAVAWAVRLQAAAESLRERTGWTWTLSERKASEARTMQAREMLSQEVFTTLWQEGRAMTEEEVVIGYALEAGPHPRVAS